MGCYKVTMSHRGSNEFGMIGVRPLFENVCCPPGIRKRLRTPNPRSLARGAFSVKNQRRGQCGSIIMCISRHLQSIIPLLWENVATTWDPCFWRYHGRYTRPAPRMALFMYTRWSEKNPDQKIFFQNFEKFSDFFPENMFGNVRDFFEFY